MEKLSGDPKAIEALKAMVTENREFLRFLVTEAQTSVDRTAQFTDKDGVKYVLKADPTGHLHVEPAS